MLTLFVMACLANPPEPRPPPLHEALAKARRVGDSWDVQAEFGVRVLPNRLRCYKKDCPLRSSTSKKFGWPFKAFDYDGVDPKLPLFGRIQAGALLVREPWVFTAGPSISFGGMGLVSLGAIAEITHIWQGVWGQFETAWAFGNGLNFSVASGFSVVGAEWKVNPMRNEHIVLLKLRIPIGLIVFFKT